AGVFTLPRRAQVDGELYPGANAELRVDVLQMDLDGVDGHEQLARDLLVRQPSGGELGDSGLRRGQLALGRRTPSSHALKLRARLLRPPRRADLVEHGRRLLERTARRTPLLESPLAPAEREE